MKKYLWMEDNNVFVYFIDVIMLAGASYIHFDM